MNLKKQSNIFSFPKKLRLAVNVGAGKGELSKYLENYFEKVYSVEADPYFSKFYENSKEFFINKALIPYTNNKKNTVKFYSTGTTTGSLEYRPSAKEIAVEVISWKDLINILKTKSIDFISLDTNGNEYALLKELFYLRVYPKYLFVRFYKANDFYKGIQLFRSYYYRITYICNNNRKPFLRKEYEPIEVAVFRSKLLDLGGINGTPFLKQ